MGLQEDEQKSLPRLQKTRWVIKLNQVESINYNNQIMYFHTCTITINWQKFKAQNAHGGGSRMMQRKLKQS